MEIIIKLNLALFAVISFIYFSSCSEDTPTKPGDGKINFTAYQIAGCNSHYPIEKATQGDTCFSYTFIDTLKVDFCVTGNCCPDSNRFVTSHNIIADTIFITVSDTAANLCQCDCNYIIHIEISGLPNNRYIFYCHYLDFEYNEVVIRPK